MSEGLLTEEEVKSYLKVDPDSVQQLIRQGKLTAYRIGGSYVRYRKDEVMALKSGRKFKLPDQLKRGFFDKVRDFWNFYSVYILLSIAIALLIVYLAQS